MTDNQLLVDILEDIFGEPKKFNQSTGQIAFDCPVCSEEKGMPDGDGKGNLEINVDMGVYRCWACGETHGTQGKNLYRLIKQFGSTQNIKDYRLFAPEQFAKKKVNVYEDDGILRLPKEFTPLTKNTKTSEGKAAIAYLAKRNIKWEEIEEFNIGYAEDGDYGGRVIIPSYDVKGELNYFVARAYGWNKMKYMNPSVPKTEIIFNENKINWDATIYLVEGAFDHIVVPNSIALLGKVLSENLHHIIHKNAAADVIICLDSDAWDDAKKIYKELDYGRLRGRIKIAKMPNNHDISSINEKLGKRGVVKVLSKATRINESRL